MPQFTWIGKDKVENHDKDLPFRVLKPNKSLSVGTSDNLLIEGDNLEALKALMPFYYNKIKCIYIDPPYNTGNEGWVYNDKVNAPQIKAWLNKVVGAEGEDLCRHDKWLCMMYPRLKLLHELLRDDGAIFVSIDDNEQSNLKQIMDELFGENNFITNIIWEKNYSPRNDAKFFSASHDFIMVYAKSKDNWQRNLLLRTEKQNKYYKFDDNDGRGLWRPDNVLVKTFSESGVFGIKNPNTGEVFYPPKGSCYRFSETRARQLLAENKLYFGKDGKGRPQLKRYLSEVIQGVVPQTLWKYEDVGHNQTGKNELNKLVGMNVFDSPKPVSLIKQILQIATTKDDIVLDSFAGSGTTGQAVLEFNKEDGGNRKFILVELESKIARNVAAKRLRLVVKGNDEIEGTDQGFQYLELNGELFDNNGFVNPNANYEDMASYIYFTETHNYLEISTIKNPYVGSMGQNHYYLLFSGKGGNVLDEKTVKKILGYDGTKIVYADKCLLDEEYCMKNNIIFKQIPYELKQF